MAQRQGTTPLQQQINTLEVSAHYAPIMGSSTAMLQASWSNEYMQALNLGLEILLSHSLSSFTLPHPYGRGVSQCQGME